jgi:tellurite resistance protein
MLGTPPAVLDAIDALTAVVLLVLGGLYALQGPRQVLADLRDPVQAPFVPVPALTAMILAAALARYSFAAGRVLVIIFLAVTITAGGWLAGQWIARDVDQASVHPGYYLPTVAAGMVGAAMLARVHLRPWPRRPSGSGSRPGCSWDRSC